MILMISGRKRVIALDPCDWRPDSGRPGIPHSVPDNVRISDVCFWQCWRYCQVAISQRCDFVHSPLALLVIGFWILIKRWIEHGRGGY